MSYTPKAPKPVPTRTFHEVSFVFGKDWKWTFPSILNLGEIAKFKQITYNHCNDYLIRVLNSPIPTESKGGMDTPDLSAKESEVIKKLGLVISGAQETDKIIPTDKQISWIENRFSRSIVAHSEWNDGVIKEQLDFLCKPVGDAPKVSEVWDECDAEVLQDVLGFFWILIGWKEEPTNDSPQEEKSSEATTTEESI